MVIDDDIEITDIDLDDTSLELEVIDDSDEDELDIPDIEDNSLILSGLTLIPQVEYVVKLCSDDGDFPLYIKFGDTTELVGNLKLNQRIIRKLYNLSDSIGLELYLGGQTKDLLNKNNLLNICTNFMSLC